MIGRFFSHSAILVGLTWLFSALQASGAQPSSDPRLETAKHEWQKYVEEMANSRYRIEGRFRHVNRKTGSVDFDNGFQYDLCGDLALAMGDVADRSKTVRATNKNYTFEARQSYSTSWQLERMDVPDSVESSAFNRISPDDPIARTNAFASDAHGTVIKALCRGLLLWESWFPAMVQSRDFVVKSVDTELWEGRELVKVQFSYTPTTPVGNVPRDGWVLLDPELRWLIVEAKTKGEWSGGEEKGTLEVKNSYIRTDRGTPLLKRQEILIRMPEDGTVVDDIWTREYGGFVQPDCSPEKYTLAAFGLLEQPFGSQTAVNIASRRVRFLIIGNVLVFSAMAVWLCLAWRRKRKNRTPLP